ncbi:unnamed protein product [Microthlaspi erraticum]|uniref:Uncharacterized protein n=1 Tax=Microthlaspi erraticum TaxID=1685480 RepID=A0A6D2I324_9BRAS|nr:unnamed protein product [Microthlaspi erraticum]
MPAVDSIVSDSCDTNMSSGGPNGVDGNCDSDRQQSMDGELQLPKAAEAATGPEFRHNYVDHAQQAVQRQQQDELARQRAAEAANRR